MNEPSRKDQFLTDLKAVLAKYNAEIELVENIRGSGGYLSDYQIEINLGFIDDIQQYEYFSIPNFFNGNN